MSRRRRPGPHATELIRRACLGALLLIGIDSGALGVPEAQRGSPAAREKPAEEAGLATLTLTPEAETRLGIMTAAVERRTVERRRTFGGEVIVPLRLDGDAPAAGAGTGSRQSIFSILPSLAPTDRIRIAEAQIEADGQVEQAKVRLDAVRVALERAEALLRGKAGSVRAVDEARTQVGLAESALRTAQARRDLLGAPLLDVTNPEPAWVRVPVYVGDLAELDTGRDALVGNLADPRGTSALGAKPVVGPPSANPSAASVDVFYEVENEDGALCLGQKVGVTIPLKGSQESLVVPSSAVVHDIEGGTWVYEHVGPQSYARRRVQVRSVVDQDTALESGPPAGARVVTSGAAELFGTEFGIGH
jgi:hypothetical protein